MSEKKVNEYEIKALERECSVIIHNKLPTKFKGLIDFIPWLLETLVLIRLYTMLAQV